MFTLVGFTLQGHSQSIRILEQEGPLGGHWPAFPRDHPLTESDEEPALGTPGSQVFELGLNGIWGFSEPPTCLGLLSLHNCVRQFQVAHGVYTLNVLGEYMNLEHLTYTSWDLGQAGKYSQASVL